MRNLTTADLNLFYSYNTSVESAYIITVKDNVKSEELYSRCKLSCDKVGMPSKKWHAYNGLGDTIVAPDHLRNDPVMKLFKISDHYLTRGEVACALSHISLWAHCIQIDRPIVILEHDAVMVKKIDFLNTLNSIVYLGGAEWAKDKWTIMPIPPHASEGPNYHFICRAHAYAIDPHVAKNMLAHVLKMGICTSLDMMLRADIFNITHQGLYAYDDNIDASLDTTIKNRPLEGRTTKRNDSLSN